MNCILKNFFFISIFFNSILSASQKEHADLIIFSFDRPIQLYALLESVKEYVTGIGEIEVIYRASNKSFSCAYDVVKKDFSSVRYTMQGDSPRQDFKPLTLHALLNGKERYVLFAVDDIIVKDYINLSECIATLEQTKAYGFYLRMGLNLNYCYPINAKQRTPHLTKISNDTYMWRFDQGEHDWNYPNTVDMTLYRKNDIKPALVAMHYQAPNTLEANWSANTHNVMYRYGLCYEHSKIVNVPLNVVQREINANRAMHFMSAQQLLEIFNQQKKIDIKPLFKINNKAAHMNYEPTFMERITKS